MSVANICRSLAVVFIAVLSGIVGIAPVSATFSEGDLSPFEWVIGEQGTIPTCSFGTPSSASCGTPTARCNDNTYSCSQNRSGTCSQHNGVSCWICPGALCGSGTPPTPPPPTPTCSYALSLTSASHSSAGGTASLSVSTTSTCAWTATSNASFITVTAGASSTGSGAVTYSISANSSTTSRSGTMTIAGQTFTVSQSGEAPPAVVPAFGQVDTPLQQSTGLVGAIAVTGWALDNVGVRHVRIYRQCLSFENQAACQVISGTSVVFVGTASIIPNARPDVAAAYPSMPAAHTAGWGFLVLSNLLPHIPRQDSTGGGQGTFTFHVFAEDIEGNVTRLGRTVVDQTPTTVSIANDTITKPFGAIDTPSQGGTASGASFANFGWSLTPDPGTGVLVPVDGSTTRVFVDGSLVGNAAYNHCRGSVGTPPPAGISCDDDVSAIFRGNGTRFRNLDPGRGPIGVRVLDTRPLANGLHTISWAVTDSANRAEGIGSRFFLVSNTSSSLMRGAESTEQDAPSATTLTPDALVKPETRDEVWARTGFDLESALVPLSTSPDGGRVVRIPELGRIEIRLPGILHRGLEQGGQTFPLPAGTAVDESGVFTWAPGPGVVGEYDLVLEREHDVVRVRVNVVPGQSVTGPLRMAMDGPSVGAVVEVSGWAYDPAAWTGTGVGAVHVWAQRRDTSGGEWTFLGTAELGISRQDVAAAHGTGALHSGFRLAVSLPPGEWVVTSFAWSLVSQKFENALSQTVVVK